MGGPSPSSMRLQAADHAFRAAGVLQDPGKPALPASGSRAVPARLLRSAAGWRHATQRERRLTPAGQVALARGGRIKELEERGRISRTCPARWPAAVGHKLSILVCQPRCRTLERSGCTVLRHGRCGRPPTRRAGLVSRFGGTSQPGVPLPLYSLGSAAKPAVHMVTGRAPCDAAGQSARRGPGRHLLCGRAGRRAPIADHASLQDNLPDVCPTSTSDLHRGRAAPWHVPGRTARVHLRCSGAEGARPWASRPQVSSAQRGSGVKVPHHHGSCPPLRSSARPALCISA